MSSQTVRLPIDIKLDEKNFRPSAYSEQSKLTIALPMTFVSGTYVLPIDIETGVLTNNGVGGLSWSILDTVEKTDTLSTGTFKIIQHGTGDSDVSFTTTTTPLDYSMGIDQSTSTFKLSNSASLGTNDVCIFETDGSLTLFKNLSLPDIGTDDTVGIFKLGACNFAYSYDNTNLFIGEETATCYDAVGGYNICIGIWSGSELTTGEENTFVGQDSGEYVDAGGYNTFMGSSSGASDTAGSFNTFLGAYAGSPNEIGSDNTYVGFEAGNYASSGDRNTYVGSGCGAYAEIDDNTCVGYAAGQNMGTEGNTFVGSYAGYNSYMGVQNTFIGKESGYYNDTGNYNCYFGYGTSYSGITASGNTVMGAQAFSSNTLGGYTVAIGRVAVGSTTNFNQGVAIGAHCAQQTSGSNNVLIGFQAIGAAAKTANNSVIIGADTTIAAATFTNRVCIGYASTCDVDNGFVLGTSTVLVGIRKNNPSQPLDVVGNAQFTGQIIAVPQTTPTPAVLGAIYFDSGAGKLKVCTNAGIPTWETIQSAP